MIGYSFDLNEQNQYKQFSSLRDKIEQERTVKLNHRININPHPTTQESTLGAFIEMYEQHLRPIIYLLLEKGYVMDISSGFCGKYYEAQSLNGFFPTEEIIINKLAKIGVKLQKYNEFKSLKFWPEAADLNNIVEIYTQIASILPKQKFIQPSQTKTASNFRMTYIPQDTMLKKQRLFEILMFEVSKNIAIDLKKRLKQNPQPDEIEYKLGVFREMLEPQVRNAVLEFNKKGYSTDISGFNDKAESQMIEGDFNLEESVRINLEKNGVLVETNPSGYTKLQFYPDEADIQYITDKWDIIASLLPNKGIPSSPSMTRSARNFRKAY